MKEFIPGVPVEHKNQAVQKSLAKDRVAVQELAAAEETADDLLAEDEAFTQNESNKLYLTVPAEASGNRLDVFITESLGNVTRSFVQKLLQDGQVWVNERPGKANFRVAQGQNVAVTIPPPVEMKLEPENIPLNLVFEDEELLVVNKPQGLVVHPAPGNHRGTLVNALLYHCSDLSGINGVMRPGIVHRIDKDTSGLLVVAKTDRAYLGLAEQIKAHSMARRYLAILHGLMPEPEGTVDAPVGRDPKDRKKMAVVHGNSKPAITHYRVIERFREYSYVECSLETGRTHQIRVHMAYMDHPVVGDPLYGPRKNRFGLEGQALHAAVLGFVHPTRGDYLEFTAPPPDHFSQILSQLRETGALLNSNTPV